MSGILSTVNGGRAVADESARIKLQDGLRGAAESMETPNDMMVRLINCYLELSMIKTGIDLGLFRQLAKSEQPLSAEELASDHKVDPLLMRRVLRYLAACRIITETSRGHYAANNWSRSLTVDAVEGGVNLTFDVFGPAYQALPTFFHGHKHEAFSARNAFMDGFKTDNDIFAHYQTHPQHLGWFQNLMSVPRDGDWLDVIDFQTEAKNAGTDRALFIDVGGNVGHQSRRLRERYPSLPGKVIVQDLEEHTSSAPRIDGVEFMAHDFFKEQPVKDARFYYMRTVLHDWDDEKSEAILRNISSAMGPDSQILIDEMALPDANCHWWSACLDLHMYTMLGALERTEKEWADLLDKSGLKLVEIRTYMPVMRNSIIIAEKK